MLNSPDSFHSFKIDQAYREYMAAFHHTGGLLRHHKRYCRTNIFSNYHTDQFYSFTCLTVNFNYTSGSKNDSTHTDSFLLLKQFAFQTSQQETIYLTYTVMSN